MTSTGNQIISSLCYQDAPAAIDWLGKAFGFTAHLVVPGEEGVVMHAQLKSADGKSMIMLYSVRDGDPHHNNRTPDQLGGNTQSLYMVEPDLDNHHARAAAAGAKVLMPPTEQEYRGSYYTCVDPEGHVWNFGSYDPWADTDCD